jgi:flagellar basal body rod protein FlgG
MTARSALRLTETFSTKRAVLGQLRLVGFANPELLQPAGESLLQQAKRGSISALDKFG